DPTHSLYVSTNHISLYFLLVYFQVYDDHRNLHSFPTRRSSDLFGRHWMLPAWAQFLLAMPVQFLLGARPGAHRLPGGPVEAGTRSEEHTSELQSRENLVCRLLLEKKKNMKK